MGPNDKNKLLQRMKNEMKKQMPTETIYELA